MTTYRTPLLFRSGGFTLVEVLVTMTVIAILAGLLSVAVGRAFNRANEFAVQNEMMQLEAAIEKFNIEYGFYPPSFKNMDADILLGYLGRIAPQNAEASISPISDNRRIDDWWEQVGSEIANAGDNPGADIVFWLSGLAKNKQYPLTRPTGEPLAAHNLDNNDNNFERQEFYEFEPARTAINGAVASYSLSDRKVIPFVYLDAKNYLPSGASATDGAYCRPGFSNDDYMEITGGTLVFGSTLFKNIYPNADSFQLISFGLDGLPGESQAPNRFNECGIEGADNFVNFGGEGITKLETVVLELN